MEFHDHSDQLSRHYQRVFEELGQREAELGGRVSDEYRTQMRAGLQHWVQGANAGKLTWGIFHVRN